MAAFPRLPRRGPVRRQPGGFSLHLTTEEQNLLSNLLDQLEALLADDSPATSERLSRLFPPAYSGEADAQSEREEEYQRLMRSELLESRRRALGSLRAALDDPQHLDTERITALMQSINALRLVIGTLLGIDDSDDDAEDESDPNGSDQGLRVAYEFLSWLLDATVHVMLRVDNETGGDTGPDR